MDRETEDRRIAEADAAAKVALARHKDVEAAVRAAMAEPDPSKKTVLLMGTNAILEDAIKLRQAAERLVESLVRDLEQSL